MSRSLLLFLTNYSLFVWPRWLEPKRHSFPRSNRSLFEIIYPTQIVNKKTCQEIVSTPLKLSHDFPCLPQIVVLRMLAIQRLFISESARCFFATNHTTSGWSDILPAQILLQLVEVMLDWFCLFRTSVGSFTKCWSWQSPSLRRRNFALYFRHIIKIPAQFTSICSSRIWAVLTWNINPEQSSKSSNWQFLNTGSTHQIQLFQRKTEKSLES